MAVAKGSLNAGTLACEAVLRTGGSALRDDPVALLTLPRPIEMLGSASNDW